MKECENCTEWEYFEGYGYGCFCRKTMVSLNANECEYYSMRDATKEERQSVKNYINKISVPTGVNFYDFYGGNKT